MLPDQVSNPGPLTYESGALPIALRGPAKNAGVPINNATVSVARSTSKTSSRGNETVLRKYFLSEILIDGA